MDFLNTGELKDPFEEFFIWSRSESKLRGNMRVDSRAESRLKMIESRSLYAIRQQLGGTTTTPDEVGIIEVGI